MNHLQKLHTFLIKAPAALSSRSVVRGEPGHPRRTAAVPPPPPYIQKYIGRHAMPELCCVLSGTMDLTCDHRCYRLRPGDWCLVPRMVRHHESYVKKSRAYTVLWVRFTDRERIWLICARYVPGHGDRRLYGFHCQVPEAIAPGIFGKSLDHPARIGRVVSLLQGLLKLLAERIHTGAYFFHECIIGQRQTAQQRKLFNLMLEIDRRPTADYTLTAQARKFGVTQNHFEFLFRQAFGVPLRAYVIGRRLYAAADLFATTSLSVKEAAARLRFKNIHYFSRFFTRHYGITPKAFKKKYAPPALVQARSKS